MNTPKDLLLPALLPPARQGVVEHFPVSKPTMPEQLRVLYLGGFVGHADLTLVELQVVFEHLHEALDREKPDREINDLLSVGVRWEQIGQTHLTAGFGV